MKKLPNNILHVGVFVPRKPLKLVVQRLVKKLTLIYLIVVFICIFFNHTPKFTINFIQSIYINFISKSVHVKCFELGRSQKPIVCCTSFKHGGNNFRLVIKYLSSAQLVYKYSRSYSGEIILGNQFHPSVFVEKRVNKFEKLNQVVKLKNGVYLTKYHRVIRG